MAIVKSSVTLTSKSSLPKDNVNFSFYFTHPTGTALELCTAAQAAVLEFFSTAPTGGTQAVGAWIGDSVSRAAGAVMTKHYKVSDASSTIPDAVRPAGFGPPIHSDAWALPAASSTFSLPQQIAVAASYHAVHAGVSEGAKTGPHLAARLRGRLFIGPIVTTANGFDTTTHESECVAALPTDFNLAMARMAARTDAFWSLFSRKNYQVYTIVGGFTDARFDTQRRRQWNPPSRSTWGA